MKIKQVFEELSKVSNPQIARIITNKYKKISYFKLLILKHFLKKGFPVSKLIFEKWFYGLNFFTNRFVLDPRPDSETLVEAVLKDYKNNEKIKILDLGCGTGCLIISIISNLKNAFGVGIDKSIFAVITSKININKFHLNKKIRIKWQSFSCLKLNNLFDLIISNPPYIPFNDKRLDRSATFDPKIALFSGSDGLDSYRIIAEKSKKHLKDFGKIYLEIGKGQKRNVIKIFNSFRWKFIESKKDLSGIERVLIFQKQKELSDITIKNQNLKN